MILMRYKKEDKINSSLGFMYLCLGEAFYLSGDFKKKKLFVKIGPCEFIRYKDLKKFDFNYSSFSGLVNLMFSVRCLTNGVFSTVPVGIVADNMVRAWVIIDEIKKCRKLFQEKQGIVHFSFLTKKNISLKQHYKEYQKMAGYEHELFKRVKNEK